MDQTAKGGTETATATNNRASAGRVTTAPGGRADSEAPSTRGVRRAARSLLGFDTLLPGQEAAIRSILAGRDTLALLPTGGGKSAIYQLAAVERPGATLVVSPLIALQQDQLEALREADLPAAAALNSTLGGRERGEVLERFAKGELEFLLLAPEQLADPALVDALRAAQPSLFVVDEVHCVSEWGHDFRPEYRRLGAVAEAIGRPPILGLTATASPAVREDVVIWLRLRDPAIVARGFDRPNISLEVDTFADGRAKTRALVAAVADLDPPGIVYTATRDGANRVAADLRAAGVAADPYHAGLAARRRADVQEAFLDDRLDVIVATIAFGMGIDKSNVRFVLHHDVSDGLDAYYQEIGRAGRDGEPAHARLFYRADDLGLRRFQGAPPAVSEADVRAMLRILRRAPGETVEELAASGGRSVRRTGAAVARLEELEAVEVGVDGSIRLRDGAADATELPAAAVAAQERRRRLARSRVDMIRAYAESSGCRRRFILNYFGEEYEPPCAACDNCVAGRAEGLSEDATTSEGSDAGFALNGPVRHTVFGAGMVSRLEGDRVVVLFEDAGYKTIDLTEAISRGLLAPEG